MQNKHVVFVSAAALILTMGIVGITNAYSLSKNKTVSTETVEKCSCGCNKDKKDCSCNGTGSCLNKQNKNKGVGVTCGSNNVESGAGGAKKSCGCKTQ